MSATTEAIIIGWRVLQRLFRDGARRVCYTDRGLCGVGAGSAERRGTREMRSDFQVFITKLRRNNVRATKDKKKRDNPFAHRAGIDLNCKKPAIHDESGSKPNTRALKGSIPGNEFPSVFQEIL